MNEKNNAGQSPLHCSLQWVSGMEILLQANANVNSADILGYRPIDIACQLGLLEAVRLLEQFDCDLDTRSRERLFVTATQQLDLGVSGAEQNLEAVLEVIANRRRKLQTLVSDTLPEAITNFLHLSEDKVIDEYTAPALDLLRRHKIWVPTSLVTSSRRQTMYHHSEVTPSVAEQLWKAGFRDINGLDADGLPPLGMYYKCTTARYLELIAWFRSKGADIHIRRTLRLWETGHQGLPGLYDRNSTTLHWISWTIGVRNHAGFDFVGSEWRQAKPLQIGSIFGDLNMTLRTVFRGLLEDLVEDKCYCACSFSGCQAFTMLLKGLDKSLDKWRGARQARAERRDAIRAWMHRCSEILLEILDSEGPTLKTDLLFASLVRFLTFHELQITHTCCSLNIYVTSTVIGPEPAEVLEIHDEERLLIERLEELLVEFDLKYRELKVSKVQFLSGYWTNRMDEVLQEPAEIDEEKLLELGVIVHKDDIEKRTEETSVQDFRANSEVDSEEDNDRESISEGEPRLLSAEEKEFYLRSERDKEYKLQLAKAGNDNVLQKARRKAREKSLLETDAAQKMELGLVDTPPVEPAQYRREGKGRRRYSF